MAHENFHIVDGLSETKLPRLLESLISVEKVDNYSWQSVMAGLMVRVTSRSNCENFAKAISIHSVLHEVPTDNSKAFLRHFSSIFA